MSTMTQEAPYPHALESLVSRLEHKPGWRFSLEQLDRGQGSAGLTLVITVKSPNSYDTSTNINVAHFFIVPAASYNELAWRRWLFDQCLLVEVHEAGEYFKIDGSRPYAPHHGDGHNPYIVYERGTEEDAYMLTSGELNTNRV